MTESSDNSRRIGAYYDALVSQFGHDPRSCDAPTREVLEIRYRVLTDVLDLSGLSVLEVGCGLGDLGSFVLERFAGVNYTGIDVSAQMIKLGRRTYPELALHHADVMAWEEGPYDIVLAQGIFYLLDENAEAKMQDLLQQMFGLARRAIAVCAISTWGGREKGNEFRVDPVRLLEAGGELTQRTVLRHDYHRSDVCLYLYHHRED